MLANLKGLFTPEAIAASLNVLPSLETTVMDTLFKDRPTHPLPLIGISELVSVVQTVPVVRRDGTPISLKGESVSMEFIAPLPVKVKIPVTASELNDLKVIFGNQAAVSAWRTRKIDQIRRTVRDTTEAMCAVVASTGKLTWPVELEGGHRETYEVDYGPLLSYTPAAKLTAASKLPDVYKLLRDMELEVKKAGLGGNVEFWAGSDVVSALLGIVDTVIKRNTIMCVIYHGVGLFQFSEIIPVDIHIFEICESIRIALQIFLIAVVLHQNDVRKCAVITSVSCCCKFCLAVIRRCFDNIY